MTGEFFDVLRVWPSVGQPFTVANEVDGRHRVVVLSQALWRGRFGGDPAQSVACSKSTTRATRSSG